LNWGTVVVALQSDWCVVAAAVAAALVAVVDQSPAVECVAIS
jgi:hypothetical protein